MGIQGGLAPGIALGPPYAYQIIHATTYQRDDITWRIDTYYKHCTSLIECRL